MHLVVKRNSQACTSYSRKTARAHLHAVRAVTQPAAEQPLKTQLIPPVIDVAPLLHPQRFSPEARQTVQQQICSACETWGFFHVVSHGIPEQLQVELQQEMKHFFSAPQPLKEAVRRTADNSRGWADDELTKQLVDAKQIFDVGGHPPYPHLPDSAPDNRVMDGFNQWPDSSALPRFKPAVQAYFDACTQLSALLLGSIADSLGPGASAKIAESFTQHTSFLRLNYYPVVHEEGRLGISRHTDAGALTIIMQDGTAALEVWSGSKQDAGDGEWVAVDPVPGGLTINTGDMLMLWSNNRFKAPEHRVRAMTRVARYSAPFFYNPNYAACVSPLVTSPEQPARYRPLVWGEFRSQRFAGDYSDKGKEVQIDDYRLGG